MKEPLTAEVRLEHFDQKFTVDDQLDKLKQSKKAEEQEHVKPKVLCN